LVAPQTPSPCAPLPLGPAWGAQPKALQEETEQRLRLLAVEAWLTQDVGVGVGAVGARVGARDVTYRRETKALG
jgi:hypothetical protein